MIEECPVCFQELTDNVVVMNTCHEICFTCLTMILTTDRRCCICRQDYEFPIKSSSVKYEEDKILSSLENINQENKTIVRTMVRTFPGGKKEYSKDIYIVKLENNGLSISDSQLSYITPSYPYSLFLDINQYGYDLIGITDINNVTIENAKIYYVLKECRNNGDSLMIFINSLSRYLVLNVNSNYLIADIKDIIFDREGIPKELQILRFRQSGLENIKSLTDYNIQEGTTLHLTLLMRGD